MTSIMGANPAFQAPSFTVDQYPLGARRERSASDAHLHQRPSPHLKKDGSTEIRKENLPIRSSSFSAALLRARNWSKPTWITMHSGKRVKDAGFPDHETIKSVLSIAGEAPAKYRSTDAMLSSKTINSFQNHQLCASSVPFGPGVFWIVDHDRIFVTGFGEGCLAKCVGLREGDMLLSVDGVAVDVSKEGVKEAFRLLHGSEKTSCRLGVLRRGALYWEPHGSNGHHGHGSNEDMDAKMSFTPGSKRVAGRGGNGKFSEWSCTVHRHVPSLEGRMKGTDHIRLESMRAGSVMGQEVYRM